MKDYKILVKKFINAEKELEDEKVKRRKELEDTKYSLFTIYLSTAGKLIDVYEGDKRIDLITSLDIIYSFKEPYVVLEKLAKDNEGNFIRDKNNDCEIFSCVGKIYKIIIK